MKNLRWWTNRGRIQLFKWNVIRLKSNVEQSSLFRWNFQPLSFLCTKTVDHKTNNRFAFQRAQFTINDNGANTLNRKPCIFIWMRKFFEYNVKSLATIYIILYTFLLFFSIIFSVETCCGNLLKCFSYVHACFMLLSSSSSSMLNEIFPCFWFSLTPHKLSFDIVTNGCI